MLLGEEGACVCIRFQLAVCLVNMSCIEDLHKTKDVFSKTAKSEAKVSPKVALALMQRKDSKKLCHFALLSCRRRIFAW